MSFNLFSHYAHRELPVVYFKSEWLDIKLKKSSIYYTEFVQWALMIYFKSFVCPRERCST